MAFRVEKEGFYAANLDSVQTAGTLEVDLHHQEEVRENVNVVESVPAIDPAQVSDQEKLSGMDILDIPYPNTRDYRYALNYIPESSSIRVRSLTLQEERHTRHWCCSMDSM